MQSSTYAPTNGYRRRERRGDGARPAMRAATYYGRPMIKKPVWKWYIPVYFFLGGVAGGSALLGAVAELFGGRKHRSTVRHARYLTLALSLICPSLLILDLGRPARFHHMLRIFKGSSPLNVGTWILSSFGGVSGALAVHQAAEDGLLIRRESTLGRFVRAIPTVPLAAIHGLLGMALGGYTGALVAATAVPLWQSKGMLLGPTFLSEAVTSGAAALSLIDAAAGRSTVPAREEIENVDVVGSATQLGLMLTRLALMPSRVREPLVRGFWARIWQIGGVGVGLVSPVAVRLVLRLGGWHMGRALSIVTSTLSLAGGLAARFALVEAGKRSAEDPLAYQEITKGAPGEARPTPQQQAAKAPATPMWRGQVAAADC